MKKSPQNCPLNTRDILSAKDVRNLSLLIDRYFKKCVFAMHEYCFLPSSNFLFSLSKIT